MKNKRLLSEIFLELNKFNLKSALSERKTKLCINGYNQVKNYLKLVGFQNNRHVKRISLFYPELIQFNCAPVAQLVEQLT